MCRIYVEENHLRIFYLFYFFKLKVLYNSKKYVIIENIKSRNSK
jgi:hypothetical protein